MITQISYNVLIERFKAFAEGHFLIKGFTHGHPSNIDIEKGLTFPWMHVYPVEVEPRQGTRLYSFIITFADLPRDKETPAEYEREVISDCIKLAEDLIAEIQNGLTLFGSTVELEGSPSIEVFIQEYSQTLTGVNLALTLSVPWDWSACDIPADWSVGGTGSGGTGSGGTGVILETNGVLNGDQTLLNLQEGANITIVDNGFGTVTISGTGGGADDVATEFNVNHTTATGNQYVIGDRVWYLGNVYQCIANNDALLPTNATYWALIGAGFRLRQTPIDWNATSGDFQVINKPIIPAAQVPSDWNAITGVTRILNKPTIPAAQVNSDWAASSGISQILNKPTIPAAQIQSDWNQSNNAALDFIKNKPTIPAAQLPSDWNATTGVTRILNKPTIPVNLDDLGDVNTPSPTNGQVLTYDTATGRWIASTPTSGGSGTVTSVALTVPAAFSVTGSPITTAGTLAISAAGTIAQYIRGNGTLATFPTIPAAQVNSDWNATSGLAEILNKPTIPAAQINSDWNAVSGLAQILNKPTIPTTLNSLTDVNTPAPTNAQVLSFDTASGQWIAVTPASGGSVTSVALSMPAPANPAFSVGGSPVTTSGTLAVSANGTVDQYVDGTGALRTLPSTGGGGGQIFYFNGNTSQGTIGGNAFFQLGTAANTGAAANFTRATTGVIARFITDVGSPNHLVLPSGVWTVDVYLSETGGGSNHAQIEAKLYKVTGTTLTLIGTSPIEEITNGNVVDLYTFGISVPNTVTLATDRVAILFDILNTNGKTVTLYTEANKIGEVHSTYAIGLSSLNGLTDNTQTFATGTTGTDFAINSAGSVHTFNLPTASASNRGALSTTDWATFNGKLTGNAAITGATKTKITYDSKGLVTAGADLVASDMPTGIDAANIGAGTVSNTEFGYLDGLSSAIQTQLNGKQATIGLTTVGSNIATLPNPSAVRFLRINADNTVTARTAAEMVSDLGVGGGSISVLYQFANGDTLAASATRFGALFGGSANHAAVDAVRRTPMVTAGTLTRFYVMTNTAQPATGSLVINVRKNSIDQALTITIAAGSAAGVFTDLVNSVSVAIGDQMGIKLVNNATTTSAAILNNQVLLTV